MLLLLFLHIVSCCSYCSACVMVKYYLPLPLPCASGALLVHCVYCLCHATKYPPLPFPLCCCWGFVTFLIIVLVMLYVLWWHATPHPSPYVNARIPFQLKTKKNKGEFILIKILVILHFFPLSCLSHLFYLFFSFLFEFFFSKRFMFWLFYNNFVVFLQEFSKEKPYKKSRLFKGLIQLKCPNWPKGMSILMKNTCYIWLVHLTKVSFLTKYQVEDLIKMDKWSWLNQIDHIEWIRFNQIDHLIWPLVKWAIFIW